MTNMNDLNTFPKYANHHGYSDIEPYEVVKVVSAKTLEVRPMSSVFDESCKADLKFYIGGFAAHCPNPEAQRWIISSCPEAQTIRIRLTKRGWRFKGVLKFYLSDEPTKFYDYNF